MVFDYVYFYYNTSRLYYNSDAVAVADLSSCTRLHRKLSHFSNKI